MNNETRAFISAHANDDIRKLALKKAPEGVDLPLALTQIDGRQRAQKKLPMLAATDGIVYPPHISMEQCSSEITALYKAEIASRLAGVGEHADSTRSSSFVDLTGGFGIDFIYMSRGFSEATYVERQDHLCEAARENFALLGMGNARVVNGDSTEYLKDMQPVDVIYLDPARRDKSGSRVFAISDCTPNIMDILPTLKQKAHHIIIKLSPMFDWRKAVCDLGDRVSEVHIVSAEGECKELLLVVGSQAVDTPAIHCVNLGTREEVFIAASPQPSPKGRGLDYQLPPIASPTGGGWRGLLLLPNPSIMKAGCFAEVCDRYGVQQISDNSHLFLSDRAVDGFPGKSYRIIAISTMNKRELRQKLNGISRANISVRNFPITAVELRKRLKLSDGGDTYIFATTSSDGSHLLFICKKEGK